MLVGSCFLDFAAGVLYGLVGVFVIRGFVRYLLGCFVWVFGLWLFIVYFFVDFAFGVGGKRSIACYLDCDVCLVMCG